MAEAIRKIFGEIGFKDKGSKDLEKLDSTMDDTKESMLGMAQVAGAVVTAAFIALANASFEAAKELELQTVRLEVLSGDAYPALTASMNEAIEAGKGLTATGDMSTALNQALKFGASIDVLTGSMSQLQQLAFITGDDLASNMKNMARSIATGSTRFLEQNPILAKNIDGFKQLGAGYDEATKKKRELFIVDALQRDQIKIQEQYNKLLDTAAGQMQIVNTQWGNIEETIGGMIITVFKPFLTILADFLRFLGETERGMAIVKTAFIALSVAVGIAMVLAFKALAVAAWAAIVPLLPFIAIAAAVIAVVTGIVLIVEDLIVGFQGGESVIFDFIKSLKQVWTFIKTKFMQGIKWIIDGFKSMPPIVKTVASAIADAFLFPFVLIMDAFSSFFSFIGRIGSKIITFFKELGSGIIDFFKDLLPEWAIKLIGTVAGSPASASATAIERRAAGGPVQANTPFVVGEDGPEVFVPGRGGTIVPNGGGSSAGMSINTLVGTININVGSATEAAEKIETVVLDALNNLARNTLAAEMGVNLT